MKRVGLVPRRKMVLPNVLALDPGRLSKFMAAVTRGKEKQVNFVRWKDDACIHNHHDTRYVLSELPGLPSYRKQVMLFQLVLLGRASTNDWHVGVLLHSVGCRME